MAISKGRKGVSQQKQRVPPIKGGRQKSLGWSCKWKGLRCNAKEPGPAPEANADRALEEFRTRKCPDSSDLLQGSPVVLAVDEGRIRLKATRKGT